MTATTRTNDKSRPRGVRLALVLSLLCFDPAILARAQTTGSTATLLPLRVSGPPSVTISAGAPVALPITVNPADSMPANAFVRIKGLPQGAALTEGYAVAPGTWAVALNALPALKAQFPQMPGWRGEAIVQLVSVDGTVLAETQIALLFAAAAPAAPAAAAPLTPPTAPSLAQTPVPAPRAPAPSAPSPPKLSAEEQQKAERMVAQGDRFLDSGNVSVARQYFKRATDAGLAAGAMKLAATYDPIELERIAAQGVVAQPAEAKRWYERALALGAREAKERLARLASTN